MKSSEPIYYQNPMQFEFRTTLVAQHEVPDSDSCRFRVILAETAFYPEGGGQPCDHGTLNGIPVHDVQKCEEGICHYLNRPLSVSGDGQITGVVDSDRRLDFMQQHTGQHLISAVLFHELHINTLAVHMGDKVTTIEVDRSSVSDREIELIEDRVNRLICENRPVVSSEFDSAKVKEISLRRPPAKDFSTVRILSIDHYDSAPCGGVHLIGTGGVERIQFSGKEKIRGRIRLAFLIGSRVTADYRLKNRVVQDLSRKFSCGPEDIPGSINALQDRNKVLTGQISRLEELAAKAFAGEYTTVEDSVLTIKIELVENSLLRKIADEFCKAREDLTVFLWSVRENGMVIDWILEGPEKPERPSLLKDWLKYIHGKGGGRGRRAQGVAEMVPDFFQHLEDLKNRLKQQ